MSTVHSAYLAEIGAEFMEFGSGEDAVSAVLNSTADAALFDREFAHTIIAESDGKLAALANLCCWKRVSVQALGRPTPISRRN